MTFDAPSGGQGQGRGAGDSAVAGEPARRNRALLWTLTILGVVVLGFVIFSGFYTDLLWYQSVDASSVFTGRGATQSLRAWADDPIHTLVYTHGHVDHVIEMARHAIELGDEIWEAKIAGAMQLLARTPLPKSPTA